jgi:hypothetical protein
VHNISAVYLTLANAAAVTAAIRTQPYLKLAVLFLSRRCCALVGFVK